MSLCPVPGPSEGLACRLLPYEEADGPSNMALDEALLATAADRGLASLRFYGWSFPTLSLGYFQPHAPARALVALPFVRRASGGAALVHHHELTYALALPPGRAWQPSGGSWICRFHHAVRAALEGFGLASQVCQEEAKKGEVLCFLHHTPGDLLMAGHKVAGSAQRKTRGALLQHGGLLLAASPHAPQLPGMNDLGGRMLAREELERAVGSAFALAMGWHLEASAITEEEREAAAAIRAERYLSAEWNEKR